MIYDDKIILPKRLRNTLITLLHERHPLTDKMPHAAKPF